MRIKTAITEAEFTELVRPKLKLFLSVDVIGSTQFKQRSSATHIHEWLNTFVSFYTTFPSLLQEAVAREDAGGETSSRRITLWKILGDELIFTVELVKRRHAALFLHAFGCALREAEAEWQLKRSKDGRPRLALKGTAWIAGFPVGNAEVPLDGRDETATGGFFDYIGPQIDTGFRLKEHATPRKLMLAADLAFLIVATAGHKPLPFHLHFHGDQVLKGVLREKPYPLVWMDCDGHPARPGRRAAASLNASKDKLLERRPAQPARLMTYLRLWLEDAGLRLPFVHGDSAPPCKPGPNYHKQLQTATADLRQNFTAEKSSDGKGKNEAPPGLAEFLR